VTDLLTMYGVTDAETREVFLDMAKGSNEPGWWHRYTDLVADWFPDYLAGGVSLPDPDLRGAVLPRFDADGGLRKGNRDPRLVSRRRAPRSERSGSVPAAAYRIRLPPFLRSGRCTCIDTGSAPR
jgi:hypothetical protein